MKKSPIGDINSAGTPKGSVLSNEVGVESGQPLENLKRAETMDLSEDLHQRMADSILLKIASGGLKPGDTIPSLRMLANDFGSCLGTAVHAHVFLKSLGLVRQPRGKPTVVVEGAQEKAKRLLTECYTDHLRQSIMKLLQLPSGRTNLNSILSEFDSKEKVL